MNYCYVFIGPSGSGKTSLAESVFSPEQKIITYTDRLPRQGERNKEDYYFVSSRQFEEMIRQGAFAEWDRYANHKYGSSKAEIREKLAKGNCYAVLTASGFWHLYHYFGEVIRPIFISVSKETLQKRLEKRGDSPEQLQKRLSLYEKDLKELQRLSSISSLLKISNDGRFDVAKEKLKKAINR
ncbi:MULTISPECIES: guanylate kinase [unclassified Enterococcus]|uniref:guanylate kinase n=1 Tax=unclassified Enterococcus TaxID=2608891 RepID=UPI0013EE0E2D|nr:MULTISPECIES: guanylate kinase [unclassified Enterococcus]